jgi:origin recognition complex subunit 3
LSTELSGKHGVAGCLRTLLRQLLSDVPDVGDMPTAQKYYKPAVLIQTRVYRLSDFMWYCFSTTGSGYICTCILVLQRQEL